MEEMMEEKAEDGIYKIPEDILLRPATLDDVAFVAWGMFAALGMNFEESDKKEVFLDLVRKDDVLYSWRNAIVACDKESAPAGMMIAYKGERYSLMRKNTFAYLKQFMEIPFENMEDEAKAGEFYVDSVAVLPQMRKRGIGRLLLDAAIEKARKERVREIVLAVDPHNEKAQHLYKAVGFNPDGNLFIFGENYYRWTIRLS